MNKFGKVQGQNPPSNQGDPRSSTSDLLLKVHECTFLPHLLHHFLMYNYSERFTSAWKDIYRTKYVSDTYETTKSEDKIHYQIYIGQGSSLF